MPDVFQGETTYMRLNFGSHLHFTVFLDIKHFILIRSCLRAKRFFSKMMSSFSVFFPIYHTLDGKTRWKPNVSVNIFYNMNNIYVYVFIFKFFIVVQVQLSPFSHHHSPHLTHPHLSPSILPLFGFVHVSFIHVPWRPSPTPLVTVSLFFISVSLVVFCLLVCFVD